MHSKSRLIKFILEYWDILLLALTTLGIISFRLVIPIFSEGTVHVDNMLLAGILVALLTIASTLIRSNPQHIRQDIGKYFAESKLQLSDLIVLAKGKVSAVIPQKEPGIWEGFVGCYYAINPPWVVEERSDVAQPEMVKKHVARYWDPNFTRAVYFFYKDSQFPQAIYTFRTFVEKVVAQCPPARQKIKVIIIDEKSPPFTLFLGEKPQESKASKTNFSYSILYINADPLTSKKGLPHWAFVIVNDDLNDYLHVYANRLAEDYVQHTIDEILDQENLEKLLKK